VKGRYYSLNEYLKNTFNEKIYKISIDLGLTCPNRDGSLDSRGCIFCLDGSSYFSASSGNIDERIEKAKKLVKEKSGANKFIAYFQSYTNTYASAEYLRSVFYNVISRDEIVGLSIATRPDCLPDEILELISDLNKIKPVWVELGLQTSNEKSVKYIRRCYENVVYSDAVHSLRSLGINVVTHVIIGLPNEKVEDVINTVDFAVFSGTNGIKLQLLHVLENTDLHKDYEAKKFKTLTLDEYLDILFSCIERLPEDIVIHRLTGDAPKKHLVSPLWSADKKRVLNTLNYEMEKRDIRQGRNACTRDIK